MPNYKIARQRHLGESLDMLESRGLIRDWDLEHFGKDARWQVEGDDSPSGWIGTRAAEDYVQNVCDGAGIRWRPVGGHGGVDEYAATRAWIAEGK